MIWMEGSLRDEYTCTGWCVLFFIRFTSNELPYRYISFAQLSSERIYFWTREERHTIQSNKQGFNKESKRLYAIIDPSTFNFKERLKLIPLYLPITQRYWPHLYPSHKKPISSCLPLLPTHPSSLHHLPSISTDSNYPTQGYGLSGLGGPIGFGFGASLSSGSPPSSHPRRPA